MRGLGEYRRSEGAQTLVWGGLKEGGAQSSPWQLLPSSSPVSFLIFFLVLILLGKCFSIPGTRGLWGGGCQSLWGTQGSL